MELPGGIDPAKLPACHSGREDCCFEFFGPYANAPQHGVNRRGERVEAPPPKLGASAHCLKCAHSYIGERASDGTEWDWR